MKKTVMITGTSTGIGNAAALLFHRKGWNVAATIRSIEKRPMEFDGLEHLKCFTMDVTDNKEIEQAVRDIMDEYGSKWAIEGFSQGLAHELKQFGIRVITVAPGMVKTPLYSHVLTMPENRNTDTYRKTFTRWHAYLMGNYNKGHGPEESAKTIYKAATDKHAKLTYAAGLDAKMVLFLKQIMPNCLFNTIVRRSAGI